MTFAYWHSRVTLALTFLFCACVLIAVPISAAPAAGKKIESSSTIVISQIFGSGGSSGAPWRNDYVELFNRSSAAVNLSGWSVQYTSATGTSWNVSPLGGSVPAGGYYLLQEGSSGSNGSLLPTPDATDTTAMGPLAGKVALVASTTVLNGACPTTATIVDFVGYGTTPNCFEGAGRAPAPSATTAVLRAANGCTDTDNNNTDFFAASASPRNSAAPVNVCNANTPTRTETPSSTYTASPTATDTDTPTVTETVSPSPTSLETPTLTATPTRTWTSEASVTATEASISATTTFAETLTPTPTFTHTPTPTVTETPSPTETVTSTPTASETPENTFTPTETETVTSTPTVTPPSHLVISQIYGAGGISGATYQNDFVELFNPGAVSVHLNGWSVQYTSAGGTSWNLTALPDATLLPGQYFLVKEAGGANGVTLPEADATGNISMSPVAGKVALVYGTTPLNGACPTHLTIADFVGYGTTPNCAENSPTGMNLSATTAALRKNNGCFDTGNNAADFVVPLPAPSPRNSGSPLFYCQATATPTNTPTQTLTPTQTPTFTVTPSPTTFASGIVINEFLPKPATDWNQDGFVTADDEWIELYNPNSFDVDIGGWRLDDFGEGGSAPFVIRESTILEANGFLLFFKSETALALNDTGDEIRLLFPDSNVADAVTFADTRSDQAFARYPDGAGVLMTNCVPSPNLPNCTEPSSPTPTATATETLEGPTPTPTETFTPLPMPEALDVVINEVAWAGTLASTSDEWIELYNNRPYALDLDGWTLDDGGDIALTLTGFIPAHGFYLLERTNDATVSDVGADQIYTGSLNNNGETLTLRDIESHVIDTANSDGGAWAAGTVAPPCAMERKDAAERDTQLNWLTGNNATRNGLDADGNPICGTPKQENSLLGPTATPTATGTRTPGHLYVNEFMADPAFDWNGDAVADENDEWIEVYNANAFEVNLSGWSLDDVGNGGSAPYRIPDGTTIAAHGFIAFSRAVTRIVLNNANDDVRLLTPDDAVADMISYKTSDSNASWSRVPDGANYFVKDCPPTPNASNCSIAPTPTFTPTPFASQVVLNEILSAPYKDWNHDSVLDSGDEWVELFNASGKTVDLSGWYLDDGKGGSSAYRFLEGLTIAPHAYLVLYSSETRIGLNNDGDTVRLLHPDRSIADKTHFAPLETNKSLGRAPDNSAVWRVGCAPTPGARNCSKIIPPTPTRVLELTMISAARNMPDESRVSVLGSVVAHPCELDTYGHEMTISDGSAGLDVYLAFPHQLSCLIPRGEQLVVTGVLRDHMGMLTLYPDSNDDITRYYAPPHSIPPRPIHTGDLDEAVEAMLVTIEGSVSNGKNGDTLWVNDGTGAVEVYADPDSHTSLGNIPRGSVVRVSGIGYQYAERYYLRVRAADDVIVLERAEKAPNAPNGRGVDIGAVSIAQALETRPQNYVTVGGVVTVPPGVIAPRDFWVQDASGGVHVFLASGAGAPPRLDAYTNVTLRGRVVSSFGAREIRIELPNALEIFGAGKPITPMPIHTGHAEFSNEGKLVTISGFVSSAQGREIYVDDGSGEVLVYLDANTKIRWGTLRRGDPAQIIGVLTRYRGAPEILPRFASDVQFGAIGVSVARNPAVRNSTFVVPVADKPDALFLQKMRPLGRIGEDIKYTNRVSARAFCWLAPNIDADSKIERATFESRLAYQDGIALVSYLLLGLAAVSGTTAVYLYRREGKDPKSF